MRILLLLTALLAGCATEQWVRSGSTEADFNRDSYACEKDVAPVQHRARAKGMYERCMLEKGWTIRS